MKYIKLIATLVLTIVVFYCLNTKLGSVPPIGKFLDPVSGVWQNDTDEIIDGNVLIKGLSAPVTIHYDEQFIPHIFAENDADLYKAQGYITAKHRLWQMEFQTHAAAGRLSEIVGESALNYDRQERRRGMGFGAEKALKVMQDDPEISSYLEAYRDGVNSYINSLDIKSYPVEYKLLDYKPEAWTTKKTALLLMYMTKMLAGGDEDLEYTNLLRKFGKDRFDLLFPDFFDVNDPIIPKETDWSYINVERTKTPQSELPLDTIRETIQKPNPDNGSNNWAVSGAKSTTGNPILANDPHLGLNLPSIWFVMQLSTPEHTAMGATLPGALGVISGFNNHIAWGETNATRDVLDWYKIEFKDASRTQYKHGNQWKNTSVRVEEIKVKGAATVIDSVIYTHHGPVTYDHTFKSDNPKAGYAMQWIGLTGGNNQLPFLALNKSKNYEDYVNALKTYTAPAQNFVFASTEGDIAIWIQGLFPNKWKGQGKFLMDGTNPEHDWQSFIPQEFNAHVKNPERGFVSSANQHPVDENYPFYVFNDGYETYRNRVINDFFKSKEKFSIDDFKDLHNNNYNLKAAELLPHMITSMDISLLTSEELEIYNQVKSWDLNNDIDQIGPSIWTAWWSKLYNMIWDEFDSEDELLVTPYAYQAIYLLKNHPEDSFMDILDTPEKETANDLFVLAFKEAAKTLTDWKAKNGDYNWQAYKGTRVGHLLQSLPAFSRFDLPIGGDRNIVNATSSTHGPSWRMIVEMSSPPKALGIYPGGQSGNPGSKYYDNMIDDWAGGRYYELNFMQHVNSTSGLISTQTLNPSK
ncbi:penicillin acylase family protein [Psychroserpens algicola]|uniref:Penicillin acylase family protein n=1 Tax=Psychroserpens algicola TaxID=1719034 RepID=A0ABT0HAT9_9FLAO|nr:penicillin acylase family protein [Psychroserpens algicola]MCK8481457.1 penicillin acylase family protein [Psychroserpens algicola]